ncbi:neutral amino acid transporter 9 [Notothenia coriiceps]|uniref:Neutral amino acid transporter 9 n=1 Tax=Notothenia coriiceps TaxID=8208 RepID=A0A6I9NF38_9TELE|nr:PREDICTED: putative sodium-coupled neutral amino acid transporter 9 [Notothenia coriiceps]
MEDDCRPLLSSDQQPAESYSQRGSTDSLDFRAKRPFYVEPRNIVGDVPQERVSAEAAILNSRVHYYSRLTASSDRLLVSHIPANH